MGASRNHIAIRTHAFILRENSAIRMISGEAKHRLGLLHFSWKKIEVHHED
jgi:hypothetical protein